MDKAAKKEIKRYVKARDRALKALDLNWMRKQLGYPDESDEVLLMAAHKARIQVTNMPEHYKVASRKWLRDRGYSTGEPNA